MADDHEDKITFFFFFFFFFRGSLRYDGVCGKEKHCRIMYTPIFEMVVYGGVGFERLNQSTKSINEAIKKNQSINKLINPLSITVSHTCLR